MRYPNRIRTPASAARRAGPIDHDVKVKQRHQRVIRLVALSRQVHGETFEITERVVKDDAGGSHDGADGCDDERAAGSTRVRDLLTLS